MNLGKSLTRMCDKNGISVSVEILPTKSKEDTHKILKRLKELDLLCPLQFCAVTWHMRNTTLLLNDCSKAIKLANHLQLYKMKILLHVAVGNLPKEMLLEVLHIIKANNIQNIFALRGDTEETSQDFPYAVHLVKFIRRHVNKQVSICVAGYPDGHPDASSYEDDIIHLKEKVDAGANFIITQVVLDAVSFISFVKDCKASGINVPILPGIMPIQDYSSFAHISKLCRIQVPKNVRQILQSIKNNDETVRLFGVFHAVNTIKLILNSRCTNALHFFSMNRTSSIIEILKYTDLIVASPSKYIYIRFEEDQIENTSKNSA